MRKPPASWPRARGRSDQFVLVGLFGLAVHQGTVETAHFLLGTYFVCVVTKPTGGNRVCRRFG